MVVHTSSEKVERCRSMLTELLLSEQRESSRKQATTGDDRLHELQQLDAAAVVERYLMELLGRRGHVPKRTTRTAPVHEPGSGPFIYMLRHPKLSAVLSFSIGCPLPALAARR